MPNYDFEKLSSKEFENLANALCAKFISRGTNIFGSGTDGGREATYRGKMDYPTIAAPWAGYLVVQCKQKERLGRTLGVDTTWALAQLNAEMKMYEEAVVEREKPEYFLFITNVELSAKRNSGGKDKFLDLLEEWREKLDIKEAHLWDRDKLSSLLDGSKEIAERFGQLLPGDIIHEATKFYITQAEAHFARHREAETALSLFVQRELYEDQYVNIKQAGDAGDEQPPLARVFVDLRASSNEVSHRQLTFYSAAAIQQASDCLLVPSKQKKIEALNDTLERITPEDYEFIHEPGSPAIPVLKANKSTLGLLWRDPSRFVVIGGPGQGKSTLVQYLAQRHRAALLNTGLFANLDPATQRAITSITGEADTAGIGLPKHARLPFRIILEQLANDLNKSEIASVMDYIAATIRSRSGMPFTRRDAESLLTKLPWLVIFDGLDEVPAVSNRKEVLTIIRSFLMEARLRDADLLVIATTRPQGYSDEFDPSQYNHLTLEKLAKEEAMTYAEKLVSTKYHSRPIKQQEVLDKLKVAVYEKATGRLMVSPLQVTIMAVLVESIEKLPSERYNLFQSYYDIIYKREQGRARELSSVLTKFHQGIKILHDRIGLQLQIAGESEEASTSSRQSRISKGYLEKLINDYLQGEGYEDEELKSLVNSFITIATDRLVFIMPLEADSFGFEVRSLQEFSAARALTRNNYVLVKERLRAIATIPYWLNTTLFAIGSSFTQGDDYCDMAVQLCNQLNDDDNDTLLSRILAGSRLALSVLEENIGDERPIYRKQFLASALRLVTIPDTDAGERLAALYEPKYEQKFKEAAQAAAGIGGESMQLGMLVMLAIIGQEVSWAEEMLERLWPTKLEDEQQLLEHITSLDSWHDWLVEKAVRVAMNSPIDWALEHLSENLPVDFINDLQVILDSDDTSVLLRPSASAAGSALGGFAMYYPENNFSEDFLAEVVASNPVHPAWRLLAECRNFLVSPSAATLAESIESVVKAGFHTPSETPIELPWQLYIILRYAESTEELTSIAARLREGKLGDVKEWLAAEERWDTEDCTSDDFCAFTAEEWPFTAQIAERGIHPLNTFSYESRGGSTRKEREASGKEILEAFEKATSLRVKSQLAQMVIETGRYNYQDKALLDISIETLVRIVESSGEK
jgi:hypothetical protein